MDIARGGPHRILEMVNELDDPSVEAIVQVGTDLSFVSQADALESELGKPVVAINASTLWHALREHGFDDRDTGAGSLLRDRCHMRGAASSGDRSPTSGVETAGRRSLQRRAWSVERR
ncbi:hypothetical protein ACWDZ4_29450 [Streptomyces sp. NPDC003016]